MSGSTVIEISSDSDSDYGPGSHIPCRRALFVPVSSSDNTEESDCESTSMKCQKGRGVSFSSRHAGPNLVGSVDAAVTPCHLEKGEAGQERDMAPPRHAIYSERTREVPEACHCRPGATSPAPMLLWLFLSLDRLTKGFATKAHGYYPFRPLDSMQCLGGNMYCGQVEVR
ncbi:hypothetical protein BDZ45DRAFT_748911 [Acephala macrosclerotiorum]|nr:hypothetical protein BDZ45DRAFT_748911 [Acephala macrosclerotiorum]